MIIVHVYWTLKENPLRTNLSVFCSTWIAFIKLLMQYRDWFEILLYVTVHRQRSVLGLDGLMFDIQDRFFYPFIHSSIFCSLSGSQLQGHESRERCNLSSMPKVWPRAFSQWDAQNAWTTLEASWSDAQTISTDSFWCGGASSSSPYPATALSLTSTQSCRGMSAMTHPQHPVLKLGVNLTHPRIPAD